MDPIKELNQKWTKLLPQSRQGWAKTSVECTCDLVEMIFLAIDRQKTLPLNCLERKPRHISLNWFQVGSISETSLAYEKHKNIDFLCQKSPGLNDRNC